MLAYPVVVDHAVSEDRTQLRAPTFLEATSKEYVQGVLHALRCSPDRVRFGCLVHDAKPVICMAFPTGRFIEHKLDGSGTLDHWVLNQSDCQKEPDPRAETYTIQSYLERWDLPARFGTMAWYYETLPKLAQVTMAHHDHPATRALAEDWFDFHSGGRAIRTAADLTMWLQYTTGEYLKTLGVTLPE